MEEELKNESVANDEVDNNSNVVTNSNSKLEEALSASEAEFFNALRIGNLETAANLLESYKATNGKTAFYYFRLACLNESKGENKKAYVTFKKLFFENPAFMMGHNDYSRMVQIHLKEPLEAIIAEIKQAMADYFKNLERKRIELATKNEDTSDVPDSTPFEFWRANAKLYQFTHKRLEKILEFEPNDVETLKYLHKIILETKDEEQSEWYKEQIAKSTRYWKELIASRSLNSLTQASRQEAAQKFEDAIDIVNLGLETDPLNIDLLIFKTEVLQKMGCLKEALSCAKGVLINDAHNSQAFRLKKALEAQIAEDNLSVGIELLQKAEQEQPGSAAQISKIRSAYGLLLDVVCYDEENLVALSGIHRCNIRMGETIKAQKVLERIRTIDPSYDVYSIFRGIKTSDKKNEPCFVATRVFGQNHPNTKFLRYYRDMHLRKSLAGRIFIQLYHNVGPAMAKLPEKSPVLKLSRTFISGLVKVLQKVY